MYSSVIFVCACLIQYAISQRVNGPAIINNGVTGPNVGSYAPNIGLGPTLPGPGIGRLGPDLNGAMSPGINGIGPNPGINPYGIPNAPYGGAGKVNPNYGNPGYGNGIPNAAYGGSGTGDVAVTGELPVAGMTAVTGQVPLTGKVSFNGNVPCGGIVTITGSCGCGSSNLPFGAGPFHNKPYGY